MHDFCNVTILSSILSSSISISSILIFLRSQPIYILIHQLNILTLSSSIKEGAPIE